MWKVNISLFLMESLQSGEILDEDCINDGFYWRSATGIYYAYLEGEGVAVVGVRAADWPSDGGAESHAAEPMG